jgi:hypothetical protein
MTRIHEAAQADGGVRLLVLGAGHYPHAQQSKPKVPKLADIGSAARSAVDFATRALTDWRALFRKPIASLDLLVNDATQPDGVNFACVGVPPTPVDAPTLANILAARTRWLADVGPNDILIFYCCGHGIWMPSIGRTFLASDFGIDPESVWPGAVAIDRFIEGMGDKAAREQWLMFDCCANLPPQALRNSHPAANALVEATEGRRKAMIDVHGPLAQAVIASASQGAQAFGRANGRSRFMDVFIEACEGPGFRDQGQNGRWQTSLQGLEAAMATYRFRVAASEDRDYYTFARLTMSDAEEAPVLMSRDAPAPCTLLVTSEPPIKLKQGTLDIFRDGARIDGQAPGPNAEERFRRNVDPYAQYKLDAAWPAELAYPAQSKERVALPPLTEVKF